MTTPELQQEIDELEAMEAELMALHKERSERPPFVKPLTKVQRTRRAKDKVAKQSRKKNRP